MSKYQIYVEYESSYTAETKAKEDIFRILKKAGYDPVLVDFTIATSFAAKAARTIRNAISWRKLYKTIEPESIVFWQGPNVYTSETGMKALRLLKQNKRVKIIALIHDVDELRATEGKYLKKSLRQQSFTREYADAVIVHNDRMKEYFTGIGFDKNKLVSLELFDYLCEDDDIGNKKNKDRVIIAGNLDASKSRYIEKLKDLQCTGFTLYGPNYKEDINTGNIEYKGSVDPEKLPNELDGTFGLVWDGDSLESCTGKTGEYLKYNNPHKLSLYAAAGIPAIVWSESATADFVKKNNCGECIDSLNDLEKIVIPNNSCWEKMLENMKSISRRVRNGEYTKAAVNAAEAICEE